MKCINCYREIEDNLKFCNFCGAKQPVDRKAYEREHPELAGALSEEDKLGMFHSTAQETMTVESQKFHEREELINVLTGTKASLENEVSNLQEQINQQKQESTNFKRLAIVATCVAVLGYVLWFVALGSSNKSKDSITEKENVVENGKEFDNFTYYGELKNGVPNGFGVAVFHSDDPDDPKFYIGQFVDGERQGNKVMLLYDGGDFFYGKMSGNNMEEGIYNLISENCLFKGTFSDNNPYNGAWYDYKIGSEVVEGKDVKKK